MEKKELRWETVQEKNQKKLLSDQGCNLFVDWEVDKLS